MARIFYFSGTGNSYITARDIAKELGAELTPIMKVLDDDVEYEDKIVGIVAPVYCGELPRIVNKFIERVKLRKEAYIFTVATCAGGKGKAIERSLEILEGRGYKMSYGAAVLLPSNYIIGGSNEQKKDRFFKEYGARLKEIVADIRKEEVNSKEFTKPANKMLIKLAWKLNDYVLRVRYKKVDEKKCIDCGMCVKVCPTDNIKKIDGKYEFGKRCEDCAACIQWCPKQAITFGGRGLNGKNTYTHPEVKASDIIGQK